MRTVSHNPSTKRYRQLELCNPQVRTQITKLSVRWLTLMWTRVSCIVLIIMRYFHRAAWSTHGTPLLPQSSVKYSRHSVTSIEHREALTALRYFHRESWSSHGTPLLPQSIVKLSRHSVTSIEQREALTILRYFHRASWSTLGTPLLP
jgi:hypothetical protein